MVLSEANFLAHIQDIGDDERMDEEKGIQEEAKEAADTEDAVSFLHYYRGKEEPVLVAHYTTEVEDTDVVPQCVWKKQMRREESQDERKRAKTRAQMERQQTRWRRQQERHKASSKRTSETQATAETPLRKRKRKYKRKR